MPIEIGAHGTTVSGPEGMKFFRMLQLKSGLSLEIKGLRVSRGVSCYAIIKKEFGLKGCREKVLAQFTALCDEQSAKVPRIKEGEPGDDTGSIPE